MKDESISFVSTLDNPMKKNTPYQLILESLEERVFFDANPAAAIVEPTDGGVEDVTPDGAQM